MGTIRQLRGMHEHVSALPEVGFQTQEQVNTEPPALQFLCRCFLRPSLTKEKGIRKYFRDPLHHVKFRSRLYSTSGLALSRTSCRRMQRASAGSAVFAMSAAIASADVDRTTMSSFAGRRSATSGFESARTLWDRTPRPRRRMLFPRIFPASPWPFPESPWSAQPHTRKLSRSARRAPAQPQSIVPGVPNRGVSPESPCWSAQPGWSAHPQNIPTESLECPTQAEYLQESRECPVSLESSWTNCKFQPQSMPRPERLRVSGAPNCAVSPDRPGVPNQNIPRESAVPKLRISQRAVECPILQQPYQVPEVQPRESSWSAQRQSMTRAPLKCPASRVARNFLDCQPQSICTQSIPILGVPYSCKPPK